MSSSFDNVLFNATGEAITPDEISRRIDYFGYNDAVRDVIHNSCELDREGEVFVKCTARLLSNFGMTRSGPFKGLKIKEDGSVKNKQVLLACWERIGNELIEIRNAIPKSGSSRDRYLVELSESELRKLATKT